MVMSILDVVGYAFVAYRAKEFNGHLSGRMFVGEMFA